MAKPTAKNMNLNEAIFSFSNRNIRPVYLLIGNDQFLQDFFIKKLESHIFVEEAVNKNILLLINFDFITVFPDPELNIFT